LALLAHPLNITGSAAPIANAVLRDSFIGRSLQPFVNSFLTMTRAFAIVIRRSDMTGAEVLDLGREAIWLTIIIAGPVMLVGLAVGFGVSLLQTLTQIQEQTLVFVPKILSIFIALLLFLPIMGGLLGRFTQDVFLRVAAY
jgi:flagellar biosynthetic protein FliQ